MRIYGIDFTSRPRSAKPITCIDCRLDGERLSVGALRQWSSFTPFEDFLRQPGPWIAGLDFPFGQSRIFLSGIGWPLDWRAYVRHARSLGRNGFRQALDAYRAPRPPGDREHRRATDRAAGAISPQKLYGTPVALMFFEGAPRLLQAGVSIPGLCDGDPERLCIEAYPGLLARRLIGRRPYKQDSRALQTPAHRAAREALLEAILNGATEADYGVRVAAAPRSLSEDPTGDALDALLCAIQAAWAWTQRAHGYGPPSALDPLEGWIADPHA
ncbi:MAG: DUF429 domain-containing protein [Chromatiaceae bacterium]|nr:DUF429 domain-containing protein [Chromatiaceae bacterium]